MIREKLSGTFTALITPFKKDGSLDEETLRILVKRQVEGSVEGLVPVGTTGESPTVNPAEMRRIFEICVEEAKGKILVIAGTGSNNTKTAVEHTQMAKEAGVDGCLVVCPYYNKPTQEGLRQHFLEIAKVGLPIIVYNIKGRTGINMETATLMNLAKESEVIVGVKEASGDLDQIKDVIQNRPGNFKVFSGDDSLTLEVIKMGGDGVISVASNILPEQVSLMVNLSLSKDFEEAEKINAELAEMFSKLFIETNPIPVKYCTAKMGLCELVYRLPMVEPREKSQKILDEMLKKYKLINS